MMLKVEGGRKGGNKTVPKWLRELGRGWSRAGE